jgi:hypothetical protein
MTDLAHDGSVLVDLVEAAAKARGDPFVPRAAIAAAIDRITEGWEKVRCYPTGAASLKDVYQFAAKIVLNMTTSTESAGEPEQKFELELTHAQLDFLLWALGYIYGASDKMHEGHKNYIQGHHFAILPKLIGAKKRAAA